MGRPAGEAKGLSPIEAAVELAARSGVPVYIPEDVAGVCCGVPFSSKGFDQGHQVAVNRAIEKMWGWSQEETAGIRRHQSVHLWSVDRTVGAHLCEPGAL